MKFLHEKKEIKETLGLKDKKTLSEYNRNRYIKKMEILKEAKRNKFVTKNNWDLVVGMPPESIYWGNNKFQGKYFLKYGEYQGRHATKDRR